MLSRFSSVPNIWNLKFIPSVAVPSWKRRKWYDTNAQIKSRQGDGERTFWHARMWFSEYKTSKIAFSTNLSVDSKSQEEREPPPFAHKDSGGIYPAALQLKMPDDHQQRAEQTETHPGSSERHCDSERKSRILLSPELFSDASQEDVDVSVFNHLNNTALWSQAVFKALSSADAVKTFIQLGIKTPFYICYPAGWKVPACPPPPSLPFFPPCG